MINKEPKKLIIPLYKLKWLDQFKFTENGLIYTKTALILGDKIGCRSVTDEVYFSNRNTKVIFFNNLLDF